MSVFTEKPQYLIIATIGLFLLHTNAFAQKAQFKRDKPHVNIGTFGAKPNAKPRFKTLKQRRKRRGNSGNSSSGHKIDLSVCDLATFDFDKCLK